jgi:LuxR family transcriptional regulator, maltose regulon positive regulatory protein
MPRKEHQATPKIIGHILYTEQAAVPLDSPAWFDWLAHHTTFYLDSPLGTFTARRELRAAGFFWYAFRRYRKHLYKAYLGRPPDLSSARLLEVAQQLAHKARA